MTPTDGSGAPDPLGGAPQGPETQAQPEAPPPGAGDAIGEQLGGAAAAIVDRPVAVLMIFLAALVFGLVSYSQLPLNLMPDISYPTITVRTEYPGAAPQEVEVQVSRPVEEALSTVDGLVEIESRSRAESSDVVMEFDWDTDMDQAAQSIRERLQTT